MTNVSSVTYRENSALAVYRAAASDPDFGTVVTYSLDGIDSALFRINAQTGVLNFRTRPDFEVPTDFGGDNVYDVVIVASDGALASRLALAVRVINANEAPVVTSAAAVSFAESGSAVVYTAAASDPDVGTSLTWSLGGIDAALFDINASTGAVTFKTMPNFEAPADAGANNVYDVIVTASDGSLTASQAVAITVTNVNEAPSVTSGATANFAEWACPAFTDTVTRLMPLIGTLLPSARV